MKKKHTFFQSLSFLTCLILILGTAFLGGCSKADPVSKQVNELYTEKKRISYNIDKCRNELEKLTVTKAGVFILFEDLNSELVDTAYPALTENGLIGLVAVKPDEYKISPIYTELAEKGWEFAIGFEETYSFPENDEEAIRALEDYISLYGEDKPQIISFSSGNAKYRRCFDETLTKCGISVIIAPKLLLAGGIDYLEYDHEVGLLKISSNPFSMKNTVESVMRSYITDKKPLVLSIKQLEAENLSAVSDKLSLQRLNLMLDSLEGYQDIFQGKCLDYKDYVALQLDNNIEKYNEIMSTIEEYTLLIENIEREIAELVGEEVAS